MLFQFSESLITTNKFDAECAALADRHYSREKIGNRQFMPPGKTLVIRNAEGSVVFGWLWQSYRLDGQTGYNCSIFRNESGRLSSDLILECERIAFEEWGGGRGCLLTLMPIQLNPPIPATVLSLLDGRMFATQTENRISRVGATTYWTRAISGGA